MNYQTFIQSLKECDNVFVWVKYSADDGSYFGISKRDTLRKFKNKEYENINFNAVFHSAGVLEKNLYIN